MSIYVTTGLVEGKYIWPSSTELNTRLRRAITAYQRNHKKQQLKKAAAEKVNFTKSQIILKFLNKSIITFHITVGERKKRTL